MAWSGLDEVLDKKEAPLGPTKLLRQGCLKHAAVENKFEGHGRGYRVKWSDLDEVLAEEEAPLGARKLLHQGRLKHPAVQNEFEGHWQGHRVTMSDLDEVLEIGRASCRERV